MFYFGSIDNCICQEGTNDLYSVSSEKKHWQSVVKEIADILDEASKGICKSFRTTMARRFHIYSLNKAVRQSPDLLFIATSFWFEESPCAVRTNTAGLGRLCTLFVWSTLLVFEHTHAVLSSTLVLCCTMVTTSTAAMTNSRYADTDRMKNVFLIRFSKPHLDRTKAGR